jgi:hypothetical protein
MWFCVHLELPLAGEKNGNVLCTSNMVASSPPQAVVAELKGDRGFCRGDGKQMSRQRHGRRGLQAW